MQPSHSDQTSFLQAHLTGASDLVTFEHAKDMATMSQKRCNKFDKQKGDTAYQTQLNHNDVELPGPQHPKAAIEQHTSMLSSAVAKPHDAVKWAAARKAKRRRGREVKQMERLKQLLQIPGKTEQLLWVNGTTVRNEHVLQQAIATIQLL